MAAVFYKLIFMNYTVEAFQSSWNFDLWGEGIQSDAKIKIFRQLESTV